MDDFDLNQEDFENAVDKGLLEEGEDGYVLTEAGRKQLMYHYASNAEYVDLSQRLSEEEGALHSVVPFKVFFLRERKEWFALVEGDIWIATEPAELLLKLLDYHDILVGERLHSDRKITH